LGWRKASTLAAGVPDQVVPLNEYPGENTLYVSVHTYSSSSG